MNRVQHLTSALSKEQIVTLFDLVIQHAIVENKQGRDLTADSKGLIELLKLAKERIDSF